MSSENTFDNKYADKFSITEEQILTELEHANKFKFIHTTLDLIKKKNINYFLISFVYLSLISKDFYVRLNETKAYIPIMIKQYSEYVKKKNNEEYDEKFKNIDKYIKSHKKKFEKLDEHLHKKLEIEYQQLSDSNVGLDSFRQDHEIKINKNEQKIENLENIYHKNNINNGLVLDKLNGQIKQFHDLIAKCNSNGLELRIIELEKKIESIKGTKNNNSKFVNRMNILENKLKSFQENESSKTNYEQFSEKFKKEIYLINNSINLINQKNNNSDKIYYKNLKKLENENKKLNDKIKKLEEKILNLKPDNTEKLESMEKIVNNLNTTFVKFQAEQNKFNEDKISSMIKHNLKNYFKENYLQQQQQFNIPVSNYYSELYNQQYPVIGN